MSEEAKAYEWTQYRRITVFDMRPYEPGEALDGIEVNPIDREHGSPKRGDMIARNPSDETKGYLVAGEYFEQNFKRI